MEVLVKRVGGIDVHKKQVTVHVRLLTGEGVKPRRETRQFGTTTKALLELGDWLESLEVELVVMEATGVYWKPLWNLFEGARPFAMELVNPRAVKTVPGRKTDVCDAQWLADLASHGLVKPSFVPSRVQREMRDLTRLRGKLVGHKAQVANRIQKVLEDANVKLGDVASDVLGVSGRLMLRAIAHGEEDAAALAEMARGQLRKKLPQLKEALAGRINAHHRFLLRFELQQLEQHEQAIEQLEAQIDLSLARLEVAEQWKADPQSEVQSPVALLCTIPGISGTAARAVVAEVGMRMERFATPGHLASWAGLCPGNNESAGKRRSGKMRDGNHMLRAVLAECAWGASRQKNSSFKSLYWRVAKRRGKKRALMAVAHRLLEAAWWVLKHGRPYEVRGPASDTVSKERQAKACIAKLRKLGYAAALTPLAATDSA